MRSTHMILLLAAVLAASLPSQTKPAAPKTPPTGTSQGKSAGGDPGPFQLTCLLDGKTLTISAEGKDLMVLLEGKPLPEERRVTIGSRLQILDENLVPRVEFERTDGGGILRMLGDTRPVLERPTLGIQVNALDDALATHLGLERDSALRMEGVIPGGAAARSGLQVHDILLSVDGRRPVTLDLLQELLKGKRPGDTVKLEILRRNKTLEIEVRLEPEDRGNRTGVFWRVSHPESDQAQVDQAQVYRSRTREAAELRRKAEASQKLLLEAYQSIQGAGSGKLGELQKATEKLRTLVETRAFHQLQDHYHREVSRLMAETGRLQSLFGGRGTPAPTPPQPVGPTVPTTPRGAIGWESLSGPLVLTPPQPSAVDLRPDLQRIERRLSRLEELLESVLKGEKKQH